MVPRAGRSDEPGALLGFDPGSDGTGEELITVPPGSPARGDGWSRVDGRRVFREAVRHLVGHQADVRILHTLAAELGVPEDRVVVHLDRVGNTPAASIPLALADLAGSEAARRATGS